MYRLDMSTAQLPKEISARIDRLPSSSVVWSWVARVSFGGFFEIYETALTSLLAPVLVSMGIFHKGSAGLFGLPDLATFAFATFAGLFAGAVLSSAFADHFGRRPTFTWSLIWYAVATLAMGMQSTALSICIWRFIAAIGVGAEIIAVDAYLAELMPKAIRGRGFAISTSLQFLAVPVAGILSTVLARKTVAGIAGWRLILLVPAIGAILIWWVRRGLPESPRWLAEHERGAEAEAILDGVEESIRHGTGLPLPEPDLSPAEPPQSPAGFSDLFRGALLRRTLMMLVASCAVTAAFFGFGNWLPSLLEARGVNVTRSLLYTAVIAFSYPIAPLFFSLIADRIERKWQIVIGTALTVGAGLLFARQRVAAGWITLGLLITVGNNLASYGIHTYRSELFPTNVRARAIGLIYSVDRLTAAFGGYLVGFILLRGGVSDVLTFITAAALVAMIAIGVFGPRTRGLATEEITTQPMTR
jgi:putative MFS transporter